MTQVELADALGLSTVHVNLRRDGIIKSRGKHIAFTDWGRLRVVANFDPAYLNPPPVDVGVEPSNRLD